MSRLLIVVGTDPGDVRAQEAMEATAVAAVFDHHVTLLLTGPAAAWTDPIGELNPASLVDYGVTVLLSGAGNAPPDWAHAVTDSELPRLAAAADRVLSF